MFFVPFFVDSLKVLLAFSHLQSAVGGVYECGTVDFPQNQQGTHLMGLRDKTKEQVKRIAWAYAHILLGVWHYSQALIQWDFAYLAAGQVQGGVLVLIQQCQVSLGPVKKDG